VLLRARETAAIGDKKQIKKKLITFERKVIIYYYCSVRRDKICDNEKAVGWLLQPATESAE